jgi:hypothetical protein
MPEVTDLAQGMHEELSSELHALNHSWRYVHDMSRDLLAADTLNRASAQYFGTVLSALFTYALTLLARLLDPAKSGRNENCSLAAMAAVTNGIDPILARSLDEIRVRAARLLEYRNKQIAHLDRVVTLDEEDTRPQLFSWVGMHDTLQDLRHWMNRFEAAAGLPIEAYDVGEDWGDVDHVRALLRKGMSA